MEVTLTDQIVNADNLSLFLNVLITGLVVGVAYGLIRRATWWLW